MSSWTAAARFIAAIVTAVPLVVAPGPGTASAVSRPGKEARVVQGAVTFFVSRHGTDTWSREAATRMPLATIARAIRLARPGDTIVVHHGAYVGPAGYGAVPGRRDAPIRLRNAPGERVVIRGTLQLVNASYWSVAGINVTQDPDGPRKEFLVKFDGGVGWEFLDAEVWGTHGVSNLMISGQPRDYRVARTCIHDNRARGDVFMNDHNIYLMPGYSSGPGLIERNIFFGTPNGAAIKAAGPSASTGASRVVIRRNTVVRSAAGVIIGYGSNRISVRSNLIGSQLKHAPRGSRYVANYDAAVIGNHVSGVRNTVVDNGVWRFPRVVHNTADSTRPVGEARSVRVEPRFASAGCDGLRPSGAARRYGRYS